MFLSSGYDFSRICLGYYFRVKTTSEILWLTSWPRSSLKKPPISTLKVHPLINFPNVIENNHNFQFLLHVSLAAHARILTTIIYDLFMMKKSKPRNDFLALILAPLENYGLINHWVRHHYTMENLCNCFFLPLLAIYKNHRHKVWKFFTHAHETFIFIDYHKHFHYLWSLLEFN